MRTMPSARYADRVTGMPSRPPAGRCRDLQQSYQHLMHSAVGPRVEQFHTFQTSRPQVYYAAKATSVTASSVTCAYTHFKVWPSGWWWWGWGCVVCVVCVCGGGGGCLVGCVCGVCGWGVGGGGWVGVGGCGWVGVVVVVVCVCGGGGGVDGGGTERQGDGGHARCLRAIPNFSILGTLCLSEHACRMCLMAARLATCAGHAPREAGAHGCAAVARHAQPGGVGV